MGFILWTNGKTVQSIASYTAVSKKQSEKIKRSCSLRTHIIRHVRIVVGAIVPVRLPTTLSRGIISAPLT